MSIEFPKLSSNLQRSTTETKCDLWALVLPNALRFKQPQALSIRPANTEIDNCHLYS